MNDIPSAVLSEHFEERLRGRRLLAAVFTTYQFDPGFFEKEILPVFLNIQLSHVDSLRLIQLEQELPRIPGGVAVYYDTDGLISGDSPRLDSRRIPIRSLQGRRRSGVFHAKCIFALVEDREADEEGHKGRALLVATPSANLTESGWWSNVEACHVEEISEGSAIRYKDELMEFLRWLRAKTSLNSDGAPALLAQKPVQSILDFLSGTEQRVHRSSGDVLHPHFYAGGQSIPGFLKEVAGDRISGTYLEIISPFFDDADDCQPLLDLIDRFGPKEVRVFLPKSRSGAALVNQKIYESVRNLSNTVWARLPNDIVRRGKKEDADDRYVHAKVYRFFTQNPKREVFFVGSANLTRPAHQRGGNIETGFVIELVPERRPEYWLVADTRRPEAFDPRLEDEKGDPTEGGSRLQLRYHWDTGEAEGFWEAADRSPRLGLECRSCPMGEIGPLEPGRWFRLPGGIEKSLSEILKETAFITVHGDGDRPCLVLVQEEGMESKPSLLLRLSVADILRYWSLLSAEQRAAFIENRGQDLAATSEGAALIARFRIVPEQDTLFDRFAGFFHAFACLGRSIRDTLHDRNVREASYRLFGRKYDSLGTLLEKLFEADSALDHVDRYVILLCSKQLCLELKTDFPEFWKGHPEEVAALEELIKKGDETRNRLISQGPQEMQGFLDWFDRWFLKKASPGEDRVD